MSGSSEVAGLVERLASIIEEAVATIAARVSRPIDLDAQFESIYSKFDEASQLSDPIERDSRLRVLESELTQLRAEAINEEADLAQAVLGLNAMLESMGIEYQALLQPNPEEQEMLRTSQEELEQAEARRHRADSKWFFKERAIRESEQAVKEAEQKVSVTTCEVNQRVRRRVLEADIEQSLHDFMRRVEKTSDVVLHRMGVLDEQIAIVTGWKSRVVEAKEVAAKALYELDRRLSEIDQTLQREEQLLKAVENSPAEHASATRRIHELRADVERARAERNGAFVNHQSKEKFATELGIHEKTQLKLRDDQQMWISSLKSDTEERVATFRARLEAIKVASDLDSDGGVIDGCIRADQEESDPAVRIGLARDKRRAERSAQHQERLAKTAEVAAAQAEAVQQIRLREAKAIEDFKRLYGIDPTSSSFFH